MTLQKSADKCNFVSSNLTQLFTAHVSENKIVLFKKSSSALCRSLSVGICWCFGLSGEKTWSQKSSREFYCWFQCGQHFTWPSHPERGCPSFPPARGSLNSRTTGEDIGIFSLSSPVSFRWVLAKLLPEKKQVRSTHDNFLHFFTHIFESLDLYFFNWFKKYVFTIWGIIIYRQRSSVSAFTWKSFRCYKNTSKASC